MRLPADKEIEEAKEYLRERISAEVSMSRNLLKVMEWAAKKIVAISFKYHVPPRLFRFSYNKKMKAEIDAVIAELRAAILDYTRTLAVATHTEDEEDILAYIGRENHGKTLEMRLDEYSQRYENELEATIAAGMFLGMDENRIFANIETYSDRPYYNPIFAEAVDEGSDFMSRLDVKPNFGIGQERAVGSLPALDLLCTFAIAEGWMRHWFNEGRRGGAFGYRIYRGSGYPCVHCDEATKRVYSMEEMVLPLHPNCRCYAVFLYV